MKIQKILIPIMSIMLVSQVMQGQVLISLIFGDKLNSPTLKFGLDGGANFSTVSNLSGAKYRTGFNLGFYFDFLLKKTSHGISTPGSWLNQHWEQTGLILTILPMLIPRHLTAYSAMAPLTEN